MLLASRYTAAAVYSHFYRFLVVYTGILYSALSSSRAACRGIQLYSGIQRYTCTAGLQYTALQRSTVYSSIHSPSRCPVDTLTPLTPTERYHGVERCRTQKNRDRYCTVVELVELGSSSRWRSTAVDSGRQRSTVYPIKPRGSTVRQCSTVFDSVRQLRQGRQCDYVLTGRQWSTAVDSGRQWAAFDSFDSGRQWLTVRQFGRQLRQLRQSGLS